MELSNDTSDVLLENDIISPEEKEQIISRIENDLAYHYNNPQDLDHFSAGSSGLLNSILTVLALMIVGISLIYLFNIFLVNPDRDLNREVATERFESEWEILKKYIGASEKELQTKNREIQGYKLEISNYDKKLMTLKNLLKAKEQIEERLSNERNRLLTDGIADEEINSVISELEKTLIQKLSPELNAFYDSSIEEINEEINLLLSEKTKSEEKLRQSEEERDELIEETDILQKKELILNSQNTPVLEMIEEINILSNLNSQYKEELLLKQKANDLYNEILISLESNDRETTLLKIGELQTKLQNDPDGRGIAAVSVLENYVKKEDQILNESSPREQDPILKVDSGESVQLLFIGLVSLIDFNTLIIKADSQVEIPGEEEFYIFKKDDFKQGTIIATGNIIDFSNDLFVGKLKSISNTERKIHPGDLVFVKQR